MTETMVPVDQDKSRILKIALNAKFSLIFFAPTVLIKLVLPEAAQLNIFSRKIGSVAPPRGT